MKIRVLLVALLLAATGGAQTFHPASTGVHPAVVDRGGTNYPPLSSASCGTLCDNLVSYWPLDEASGQRNDVVGTNHLTDNNTVGSAAGVHNAAASFVAANSESLTIADNPSLSLGADSPFTISGWFRAPETGVTGRSDIACKWGGGGNAQEKEYQIQVTENAIADYVDFTVGNGTTYAVAQTYPTPVITDGAYHHILCTHDPDTDTLNIYVNGALAGTAAWADGTFDGNGTFAIGKTGSFGSLFATGQIDEVAIWSRVLTEAERTELYNAGAGRFYDGTQFAHLWRMEPWRMAANDNSPDWLFQAFKRPPAGLHALLKKAS